MITCRLISDIVAIHYRIPVLALHSGDRHRALIEARHMGWYLARMLTANSLSEIAKRMGSRDHSTVLNGVRRIRDRIAAEPELACEAELLTRAIVDQDRRNTLSIPMPFSDCDPSGIVDRLLSQSLGDCSLSLDDVRQLALSVRAYAEVADDLRGQLMDARARILELETAPVAAASADARLRALAREIAEAATALDQNKFSGSEERIARARRDRALQSLRDIFFPEKKKEIEHV